MRLSFAGAAFAVAALSWGSVPALADQQTEDLLKSWVGALDASPDWTATYKDISSHGDQTAITGLAITSEKPGLTMTVDAVSTTALSQGSDGSLSGSEISFDGIAVHVGPVDVAMTGVKLTDYAFPAVAFEWDRSKPLTAIVPIMKLAAGIKIASGTVGSLILTQDIDGVVSETSYDGLQIDGWTDGRIASTKSGTVRSRSPKENPLMDMTLGGLESKDTDLDAILAIFDPDRYTGGVGDKVWRTVVGSASYKSMSVKAPGVDAKIGSFDVENVRLRQPRGGIQPIYDMSAGMTDAHSGTPAAKPDPLAVLDLLSIYGIGKMAMHDFDITAPGVDSFHLGTFSMSDSSLDGIGDFTLDDFSTSVPGQGTVKFGKFSFGGVAFPPIEAIVAAAGAGMSGGNVNYSSVIPQLGYLELDGLDVALSTAPHVSLEGLRADLSNYVGPVPTAVTFRLANLDMPVSEIDDEQAKAVLTKLGYERVTVSSAFDLDWSATGDIVFKSYNFGIKDIGAISGDLTLTGITPASVDHLDPETAMAQLSFVKGSLTFKDESIVGRGLGMQAEQLKIDPAKFREQFAMGIPLMLTFIGDEELQGQLATAIQTLVKTTAGSITATALPGAPIPLMELAGAADSNPFDLLKKLSVKVTSEAGTPAN